MLRRAWLSTALIATLLVARDARAGDGAVCCSCARKTQAVSLFCGQFPADQEQAVLADCDSRGGTLLCLQDVHANAKQAALTCEQRLAEESIVCPTSAGAPALDRWGLAGLAALLAGLGALAVRRARA